MKMIEPPVEEEQEDGAAQKNKKAENHSDKPE
jgi:hypothetical protein